MKKERRNNKRERGGDQLSWYFFGWYRCHTEDRMLKYCYLLYPEPIYFGNNKGMRKLLLSEAMKGGTLLKQSRGNSFLIHPTKSQDWLIQD